MSTFNSTYDHQALAGATIPHDRARALLGQVMGYVAVTVAFAALGAYLGRDLNGAIGLVLLIGTIPVVVGLNIAAARRRDQLAIGLLFGLGLVDVEPIAWLSKELVQEAHQRYHRQLDAGRSIHPG